MSCQSPIALLTLMFHPTPCREVFFDTSLNGVFGIQFLDYFPVYLLTCVLEAPFYFYVLKKYAPPLSHLTKLLWIVVLNLSTHPLVVLGLPSFFAMAGLPKGYSLLTGELFAPIVEGLILWKLLNLTPKISFSTSFIANLFSWQVGASILVFLLKR